jgi:hypothetical protein
MKSLVGNAADEVQVASANEKVKSRRARDLNDLRQILNTVFGRRFIWSLMAQCGPTTLSFVPDNLYLTAFNEGQRNIGLRLFADINEAMPEAFSLMKKEAEKEV